jgi:hypothetical protein
MGANVGNFGEMTRGKGKGQRATGKGQMAKGQGQSGRVVNIAKNRMNVID